MHTLVATQFSQQCPNDDTPRRSRFAPKIPHPEQSTLLNRHRNAAEQFLAHSLFREILQHSASPAFRLHSLLLHGQHSVGFCYYQNKFIAPFIVHSMESSRNSLSISAPHRQRCSQRFHCCFGLCFGFFYVILHKGGDIAVVYFLKGSRK